MNDPDIRGALTRELSAKYQGDRDTIIIEELGIQHGRTRVDVAVVNGSLHGFELKSDCDTLRRLPKQVVLYGKVLDQATLVVGTHHLRAATKVLPAWWGISLAETSDEQTVQIVEVRPSSENPSPDALAITRLLWRDEALAILSDIGADTGMRSKTRRIIYQRLVDCLSIDLLRMKVRAQLKRRRDWRPVLLQKSDDD